MNFNNDVGYGVALQIVRAFRNLVQSHFTGRHFEGDRGQNYHLLYHPTHSTLFELFVQGLEIYMGRGI
eukprot:4557070-Ditylum_brightwellii.AAC.1